MLKRKFIIHDRIESVGYVEKKWNGSLHDKWMRQISEKCTRFGWLGWKDDPLLCKGLKSNHNTVWHLQKPASVLGNDTHKIVWDFKIQNDYLIPAWRPDSALINEKKWTCCLGDFAISVEERMKIKGNDKQILGPCQRTKKAVEHNGENYTNWSCSPLNGPQTLGKWLLKLEFCGRIESIQTSALLISARMRKRV